ncbi:phasin family protein [Haematospirillum sp. H1815]|uniref:phasin family protein n=1 Tax=Haematospirillum sp. H1815 TaxID=2723108 RepID=UPI00143B52D8|nr:phasin family protein [Haematospirillum sp. H1815]NKD77388.1 phasin family protein [Haematospirillum sp. H1815]
MAYKTEMPFDFDVSRLIADMKVPGIDVDSIVSSQKKNIEALNAANKMVFDGFQTIMKRQAEILRQTVEDTSALSSRLTSVDNPGDQFVRQTELAKSALETNLANARELVDMMTKSQNEVLNLLSARMSQSMDEMKSMIEKSVKNGPTGGGKSSSKTAAKTAER